VTILLSIFPQFPKVQCFLEIPRLRQFVQRFNYQLMHTTVKNVQLLKHFKIRKLLQHVSAYKETIIREPQPVFS